MSNHERMNVTELLNRLRHRGIRFWAEGDRLRYSAPKGALTEDLRSELAACKKDVVTWMRRMQAERDVPLQRIARDAELPLSLSQQRLWFLEQFEPGTTAFHLPEAVRLTGRLDVPAMRQSLREVARRHESLRTTFTAVEGRPVQAIAAEPQVRTPVVDLCRLTPQRRERVAETLALAAASRTFDFEHGPLVRTILLRLGPEEHVFLLNIHHLVFDRWSMGVFLGETAALYEAFTRRRPSPLPELEIQYADYAHWQRQRLQGEHLESLRAYWREQLGGAPGVLRLPTDRPRPPLRTENGARLPVDLPGGLVKRLEKLGGERSATLFMVLVAAFDVLLWRYTGQRDLSVGTVIAGRTRPETEKLIGYLLNTLVLRTRLESGLAFSELVDRVQRGALGAYAHQELPFEQLIEDLQPEREASFAPFFQVMMVIQNTPPLNLELLGLEVESLDYESVMAANSDWGFWLWEEKGGLGGYVEYNTDLFDATTVSRMLSQMKTLLQAAASEPWRHVSRLPLLGAATRQQLFVEWNEVPAPPREEICFHQLFERQAAARPTAPALTSGELELSYGELNERANALARRLRRLGVGPEDVVGVFLEYSPEMVVAVLGVMKSGGAFLPLDAGHARRRVGELLTGAAARVVLTQERLAAELPADLEAEVLHLDSGWDDIAREDAANPPNVAGRSNLVYMVYTSGTTGRPKGVMISHAALVNIFHGHTLGYGLDAGMVHLQMASFSFDVFTGDMVRAFGHGGRLVLCPRDIILTPGELDAYMRRHGANAAEFVPAVIRGLMQNAEDSGRDLAFLRLAAVASDVWYVREYAKLRQLAAGARVSGTYGVTEVNIDSTTFQDDPRSLAMDAYVPVGRPFAGNPLYVLDRSGRPVPPGVLGELTIGGPGVARGYFGRPALTAEKFVPDAWSGTSGGRLYCTGDRVRFLADGNIEFLGRVDFQVKIRGFRIEPGEIEAILGEHPDLVQAVVLAREESPGNRYLAAYVVTRQQSAPESGELRAFLKERLPDYMVPGVFILLDELPLNDNNKVDRRRLPVPAAGDLARRRYVAPRTPIEEALAEIFVAVTGAPRAGATDDFFELGGHSLSATQVVSRVRDVFEVELPVRKLFESPVLETLALAIEEELLARVEALDEAQAEALL